MRRRTTEEAIPTESGSDLLVRRRDEGVQVTWLCGDTVRLSWSKLREAIAYVEMFPDDVWVYQQPTSGQSFSTRLDRDRLAISPGDVRANGIEVVRWSELRDALEEALDAASDDPDLDQDEDDG